MVEAGHGYLLKALYQAAFYKMSHRPEIRHPNDDAAQVEEFLIKIFLVLDARKDRTEAKLKAQKTIVDRSGLYEISEEDWRAKYGIQGVIYTTSCNVANMAT